MVGVPLRGKNPLSVIKQITYLLFLKMLDEQQTTKGQIVMLLEMEVKKIIYTKAASHLRWKNFKNLPPDGLFELFSKEGGAFDFMKNYGGKSAAFSKFMKNAKFEIPTERLLAQVVDMLSALDKLRQEMRELIKFLEKKDLPIIKTDIEDSIVKIEEIEPIYTTFDREAYEKKIRQFIMDNKMNLIIDKLHRNIKVTSFDLQHLE